MNRRAESDYRVIRPGDYIAFPKHSNMQRGLKKLTSKRARARRDLPRKGNYYRRLVDYWWEIY